MAAMDPYAARGPGRPTNNASEANDGPAFSPELLRVYYARLFPYEQMFRWLSYGGYPAVEGTGVPGDPSDMMLRRELSFTIEDDIYIRYQCFRDLEEMRMLVQRRQPHKMDIGAVFTLPPRDHAAAQPGAFKPVERELVFDVDLTDYDDIRTCCSGATICRKCWAYMGMAMRVMDTGLREDFGFRHIVWVYSGRRGVHCWVCDPEARALTNEGRSAVADYFSVVSGNANSAKKVKLSLPIHPALRRAFKHLEPLFKKHILPEENGQGLLASAARWRPLLDTLPLEGMAEEVDDAWQADPDGLTEEEKWDCLLELLEDRCASARPKKQPKASNTGANGGGGGQTAVVAGPGAAELWKHEVVFTHCYPRLDVNVSKAQNHLLKSPFVAHPKTGRVCIPIATSDFETFDPFSAPTLGKLARQINDYDREHSNQPAGVNANAKSSNGDMHKTELLKHVQFFEDKFLKPLYAALKARSRDAGDRMAAETIDF